jgi:hypothetical protein
MRKAWFVVALLPLLMAGQCSPGARVTCPALKQYGPEFQAAAAAELRVIMDTAPHVVQMVNDLGVTRNAIRACLAKRK